ncbi:glycerate kinase [Buttiauxella brennerae ATCC 51605]|uniref:Glycerate kinase n=1 Tax=Buttiauxella brennerae ATCC 51605 TaxID=1354251 RepID=A0A1B7IVI5_9ENTR|nr:glycerate 3-kinase [Buttiauxella brennerae]OAT33925.1 glycerate kinase [Buttiauxella brennerae ATCC 51605]
MKIVIAPDSFKESLSAERTAQAIKKGFEEIFPDAQYVCLPIADGGEGTVEAMIAATRGKLVTLTVTGPMSQPVKAFYGVTGDGRTAVIEMAAASGLMLVEPELRNPMSATSFGTGELIKHALDTGIRHIILGIGGSATVDGGIGMAQALGVHFYDADGNELAAGGGALNSLSHIDQQQIDPRVKECHFEIACDVDNPLTGPRGASAVFGPQKGATPEMVIQLDNGLAKLAAILGAQTGCDINAIVGGGAAGGMGVAAEIFLGGQLKPGIDIIMHAVNLEQVLEGADLVITGEGRIDSQTVGGKAPIGVARVAQRIGVPVIGMAGVLGEGVEVVHQHGIDAVFSILPRLAPLATVLLQGEINLQHCARNIAQAMKLGQAIPA